MVQFSVTFYAVCALVLLLLTRCIQLRLNGLKKWFQCALLVLKLPGPRPVPLFGNVFLFRDGNQSVKFLIDLCNYKRSLVKGWIYFIPVVGIGDPNHLQKILASNRQTNKNFLYKFMHTFLGEGLLTTNGNKWKSHRKYIQPYFHKSVLKQFIPIFVDSADLLVQQLQDKEEVNITTYINSCVLNILHCALLGIPINDHSTKQNSPFNKGQLVVLERVMQPWYLLNFAYKFSSFYRHETHQQMTLQQFTKQIIDQRQRSTGKLEWCLLESFLEIAQKYPQFSEEEIVNEVCTFMLAGQDSVGAAVSFTLYCLAKHPEVQKRVVEELDTVLKDDLPINMESLHDLVYLKQCMKESLRLYPSVPLIARTLAEDVQLGKHTLPAGLNVMICPLATHRLKYYYPDPDKFDPDRFSPENEAKLHPYAFIPFSAGPRNCIGYKFAYLEMATIVSTVLKKFSISVPEDYNLRLSYRITLRAKGGIPLRLKPR